MPYSTSPATGFIPRATRSSTSSAHRGYGIDRAAEAIDHVGLRMEGYADFRNKLDRLGIRYTPMDLADIEERRLFFHAPGGPLLEAVFSEPVPHNN